MGYCISQGDSRFHIAASEVPKAFVALKQAAELLHSAGKSVRWVRLPTLCAARNLAEQLEEWRWRVDQAADGSITAVHFEGEKLGDDLRLWQLLAPFVQRGSFIVIHGEEGDTWRWYFDGRTCLEQQAQMSFGPTDAALPDESNVIDVQASEVRPTPRLPN